MKGIKILTLSVLLLIIGAQAEAQTVRFGVKAGAAYSSLTQKFEQSTHAGAIFGYSLAGLADIPFYHGFSFRPEVGFVKQGGTFYSNPEEDVVNHLFNKCKYYSISVPLNVAYMFKINEVSVGVYLGPALDFSLFGRMKSDNQEEDIKFGYNKESDLNSFDLGVSLGLRVDYEKYFFSIGAICGTLDRRGEKHSGESSLYQNNVTLSLGYMFR